MKNFEKYFEEIKNVDYNYSVTHEGMIKKCFSCDYCDECIFSDDWDCYSTKIKWLYDEAYKKPLLTAKEKKYLEDVCRPFKDITILIVKYKMSFMKGKEYGLAIYLTDENGHKYRTELPSFDPQAYYKGMELAKGYTLKDLGLYEDDYRRSNISLRYRSGWK